MKDVIGIGSVFVDYFFSVDTFFLQNVGVGAEDSRPATSKEFNELFSKKLPLAKSPGGSTPLTLAALSVLGKKVGFSGVIGDDRDGAFWEDNLLAIDTKLSKKGNTAKSACLLSNNRKSRSFLYTQNEKENEFFDNVDFAYLNNCQFLHITPFYTDYKHTLEKVDAVVKKIAEPRISFSPALVYTSLGIDALKSMLKKSYIVFFSQEELALLFADKEKGSKELLSCGPQIIICTLGEKGVLVTTRKKQFVVSGEKVGTIVDTTGAGDAFAAGFLAGLVEKKSLEECAKMGNKIAARSISDFGLQWMKSL
jgi:ribokinase